MFNKKWKDTKDYLGDVIGMLLLVIGGVHVIRNCKGFLAAIVGISAICKAASYGDDIYKQERYLVKKYGPDKEEKKKKKTTFGFDLSGLPEEIE